MKTSVPVPRFAQASAYYVNISCMLCNGAGTCKSKHPQLHRGSTRWGKLHVAGCATLLGFVCCIDGLVVDGLHWMIMQPLCHATHVRLPAPQPTSAVWMQRQVMCTQSRKLILHNTGYAQTMKSKQHANWLISTIENCQSSATC